ncbi:MAG: hypothetical protein H0U95_17090 [Bacteroidetes bacterium]|nr:hypothetical protein [Bacteroidota bacterium]
MTIVTNFLIFIFSIFCFTKLSKYKHSYPRSWGWFVLLVGISSCFGSTAHAVHYQLGKVFFDVVFYIMNAFSLISIYFCFRSPYLYYTQFKANPNKKIIYFVIAWIAALLIYTMFRNNFLIVKVHAGIVLLYSFGVHLVKYSRTKEKGSGLVVLGISVSFLSIIVHSLKFSINEWFNYKDFSHVIILCSLFIIYSGIKINADKQLLLPEG